VVEIRGLRKSYRTWRGGRRQALDGFDMEVAPGQVHGFLGPNGSGKTTTLRALLGLVAANGGQMRLFGREVPAALPEVAGQVGAIVESPQFFGNFSGRETLVLLATAGGIPRARVDEVLELVGLRDRARERVKSYSLGMRQRLAVASALLKRPRLLILDEPANGLDPAGIREMRDLMRNLAAEGTTVLLSSHILSEVQQICDTVTIISLGRRVVAGPVSEVLAAHATGDVLVRLESPADHDAAARVLREAGATVTVRDDHLLVHRPERPSWVTRTLAQRDIYVAELSPVGVDLESVFLELTGTAPVPGRPRQVDESVAVEATSGQEVAR
ncbi:MAG: ATP-binding cassette domain-containing protein, partial [Micromonosporaceae bacterium]